MNIPSRRNHQFRVACLLLSFVAFNVQCFLLPSSRHDTSSFCICAKKKKNKKSATSGNKKASQRQQRPKLIVFDLDGCLWKPELFELITSPGRGIAHSVQANNDENGFFAINPKEQPIPGTTLTTPSYQRLELLGASRSVLHQLYYDEEWFGTLVGISSRTDCPDWAYEAMEKLVLYNDKSSKHQTPYSDTSKPPIAMADVFTPQLCILDRNQNKADQFELLQKDSGQFTSSGRIRFRDMLFFDNEAGNCKQVAALGVTTVYCPQGVTQSAWEEGIQKFPTSSGKVLGQKMPY